MMRGSLRTIAATLGLILATFTLTACRPPGGGGGGPTTPPDPCAGSTQSVKSAQAAAQPAISPQQAASAATASAAKATVHNLDGSIPIAIAERRDGRLQVHTQSVPNVAAAGAVAAQAATEGTVVAVEAVQKVHAVATGPDPLRPQQWALNTPGGINFEQSWTRTIGCNVTVGVVDTGVEANNPDLAGRILPETRFLDLGLFNGPTSGDLNGHGTHVAGIIAAQVNNGVGIEGAAPGVKILPIEALGSDGSGFTSDIANGINWAVGGGVQVINLSLGSDADSSVIDTAIDNAHAHGVTVVAAGGNTNGAAPPAVDNAPEYPAASGKTIAVAATSNYGTLAAPVQLAAPYSTRGAYISVAAPGTDIISTYQTGWYTLSGTSMATPYVSAAVALIRSAALQSGHVCDQAHVLSILQSTATDDIFIAGPDQLYGAGIINPVAALNKVAGSC
jgi:serine protease